MERNAQREVSKLSSLRSRSSQKLPHQDSKENVLENRKVSTIQTGLKGAKRPGEERKVSRKIHALLELQAEGSSDALKSEGSNLGQLNHLSTMRHDIRKKWQSVID